jgi:hypothetical protein
MGFKSGDPILCPPTKIICGGPDPNLNSSFSCNTLWFLCFGSGSRNFSESGCGSRSRLSWI